MAKRRVGVELVFGYTAIFVGDSNHVLVKEAMGAVNFMPIYGVHPIVLTSLLPTPILKVLINVVSQIFVLPPLPNLVSRNCGLQGSSSALLQNTNTALDGVADPSDDVTEDTSGVFDEQISQLIGMNHRHLFFRYR